MAAPLWDTEEDEAVLEERREEDELRREFRPKPVSRCRCHSASAEPCEHCQAKWY